jgi:protein TonB
VQGVVRLSATIDREGRLRDIRVITGHPLLNRAAIEAVENWIYRPGRLNGEPIETNTQIDVNFTMGQ